MVIFVLTICFLIWFILLFLLYKSYIRPFMLRLFHYKKVLQTAQIILKSNKDNKIENLIDNNINDLDLIKIAEEEILKSQKNINNKENSFSFKNLWRKNNNGTKESIRQISRGENKREIREEPRTGTTGKTGTTKKGCDRISQNGNGNAEQRPIQSEPIGINERRSKYFN